MPGFKRKYKGKYRSSGSRAKSWTRGARRYKSKTRGTYAKKKVTVRMLRAVVPKPELKYHNVTNDAAISFTGGFAHIVNWTGTFKIPQNAGLGGRIGDSVWLKMIELHWELQGNSACARSNTQVDTGSAGAGNVINQANLDQSLRLVVIQSRMDKTTSLPIDGVELMGSTNSNAPGGASAFHEQLDRMVLRRQQRAVYHDKKYYLSRGVIGSADAVAPATTGAPFGICKPLLTVSEKRLIIKFPGHGLKLQFDGDATQVPVSMPVLWIVGKNNTSNNNPYFRLSCCRIWYTDP